MDSVIKISKLVKIFKDKREELLVLDNINLEISPGEFFVIVGPSGSGKSTLLRIMSGLEKPSSGEVILGGNTSVGDMSFVFQQFALLPWLNVSENIELGLVARNVPLETREKRIAQELKRFRLEKFASAYPRELSGGMRQRVGMARALATDPKIIFMDEPFSELDSFTAEELRKEFLHIWHETKTTIVMVTHLISEALELADRIAVLTPLPGRIEKIIENTLPRPRDKRSADFYRLEDQIYKLIKQ